MIVGIAHDEAKLLFSGLLGGIGKFDVEAVVVAGIRRYHIRLQVISVFQVLRLILLLILWDDKKVFFLEVCLIGVAIKVLLDADALHLLFKHNFL